MTGTGPETREGACHCGAVRFRAVLPKGLASANRCNCSFCEMRGAVVLTAEADSFEVLSGADALTLYQFGTNAAEHHFCSACGIYIHHRRRSDPSEMGVNVACLDGLSPFDFARIPISDGRHHVKDGHPDRVAGTLTYVPADRTTDASSETDA